MPAPMAPIEPSAQSKSTHSTLVRPRIPNASPLATPSARRPLAISSTAFAAAAQDIAVHSPSCSVTYAVPSRVAARRQSSAIVFVPAARSTSTAIERIVIRRKRPRQGEKPGSLYTLETSMRTIWNGSITFGLVNIPVGLALATRPAARQSDVSFRTLHRECGTPIKQKRWCPVHEREVERDELVKGWEVAKGQFVMVEDADLEAIMQIDDSKTIEISRFVDAEDVDPVFFDRTYYLAPASTPAARRPYVLLLRAMQETGKAALGRFVRQGAEHLCLIRPKGDALALETLFLAEDVNSQAEIEEAVDESEVKEAELGLARQVIDSL